MMFIHITTWFNALAKMFFLSFFNLSIRTSVSVSMRIANVNKGASFRLPSQQENRQLQPFSILQYLFSS